MTASLRSDATSGALQINGADKLLINENGSMTVPMVTGMFRKLKCSANGTSGAVLVSAEELVLSSAAGGSYKILAGVNLTGLAVTNTGANGLDTGLLAANTWYSVWVIWNGTTVAGLLSLQETSPTMPAGYTHKARVGWVRTDGTGNKYPLPFVQHGRVAEYIPTTGSNLTGHRVLTSGASSGNASLVAFVPPTAGVARVMGQSTGTSNVVILIGSSPIGDQGHIFSFGIASPSAVFTGPMGVTISQNPRAIYVNGQASTNSFVYGWEDNL